MGPEEHPSNVVLMTGASFPTNPPAKLERDPEKVQALLLAGIIMTLKPKRRRKLRKLLRIGLEARPEDVNAKAALEIVG